MSDGFEKIYTKPELLIRIYELLPFVDQLRLARVNQQFKYIFVNFIHRPNYRVLKVLKTPPDEFFVASEQDENRLLLTPDELEEFVLVYADSVEELSEDMGLTFYEDENQPRTPDVCVEHLHSLRRIQYVSLMVQEEHLHLIAENCRHLRELQLIRCSSEDDDELLMIGNDLGITTFEQMEKLKILVIDGVCLEEKFRYSIFHELVTKLDLDCLKLGAILVPDVDREKAPDAIHHQLKELHISASFDSGIWGNNFQPFLRNFENLLVLTISMPDEVTDAILDVIENACKNLQKLNIEAYTKFRNIRHFSLPPKVREFSLRNCCGLTQANLRQILTLFRIEKFMSANVVYQGEFEDFAISSSISSLDLADVSTHKFPSAYVNNANLEELKWYGNEDNSDDDNDDISACQDPGPFETCINLKTLNMSSGFMPLSALLQLKHLHKLKLPQAMPGLNWSYITALLKHPPLTELSLHAWYDSDRANDLLNCPERPTQGFPTNVKIMKLNFVVFEHGLDFWLDLFNQNPEMLLICNSFAVEHEFLKRLVANANFPRDLRTIDVWGFNIQCKALRKNYNATMKVIYQSISRFAPEYVFFEQIARLVLTRKQ